MTVQENKEHVRQIGRKIRSVYEELREATRQVEELPESIHLKYALAELDKAQGCLFKFRFKIIKSQKSA